MACRAVLWSETCIVCSLRPCRFVLNLLGSPHLRRHFVRNGVRPLAASVRGYGNKEAALGLHQKQITSTLGRNQQSKLRGMVAACWVVFFSEAAMF